MRILIALFLVVAIHSVHATSFLVTGKGLHVVDTANLAFRRDRILKLIGISPMDSIPAVKIVLARDDKEFNRLTHHLLPEWAGAVADRKNSRIIIKPGQPGSGMLSFEQTLAHELTHLLLFQTDKGAYLPRWFHEGLAMMCSGEMSWREHLIIAKAILGSGLLTLSEIEQVNHFRTAKAQLAYAQSHMAIMLLIKLYGRDVIAELVKASRMQRDFWKGFRDVLTMDSKEWEALYQKYLRKQFRWIVVAGDTWMFWIAGTVLLAIAFAVKKWQNRKTLARWDEEEAETRREAM